MNVQTVTRALIERTLAASRLAVLATEGAGQPHASLVAVTPVGVLQQLVFATYRNTRKYGNLVVNGRVALLMQGVGADLAKPQVDIVLTATGLALETSGPQHAAVVQAHLHRHPDLAAFLGSQDCAVFCVAVQSYQVVRDIDDVGSWSLAELGAG